MQTGQEFCRLGCPVSSRDRPADRRGTNHAVNGIMRQKSYAELRLAGVEIPTEWSYRSELPQKKKDPIGHCQVMPGARYQFG